MCQREFGPATEYGCLLVTNPGQVLTAFSGSKERSALRTCSIVTTYPLLRKLPHIICIPQCGSVCLTSCTNEVRSWSVISEDGSCKGPYSSHLLSIKCNLAVKW